MEDIVTEWQQLRKDLLEIADALDKHYTNVLTVQMWSNVGSSLATGAALVCGILAPFTAGASMVPAAYLTAAAGVASGTSSGAAIVRMLIEDYKVKKAASKLKALRKKIWKLNASVKRRDLSQSLKAEATQTWDDIKKRADIIQSILSKTAYSLSTKDAGTIPKSCWERLVKGVQQPVVGVNVLLLAFSLYSLWSCYTELINGAESEAADNLRCKVDEIDCILGKVE